MEEGGEREEGRAEARNKRVYACVCVCARAYVCNGQISVTLSVNITLTLVYWEAITML